MLYCLFVSSIFNSFSSATMIDGGISFLSIFPFTNAPTFLASFLLENPDAPGTEVMVV